jgi:hypothetical protein
MYNAIQFSNYSVTLMIEFVLKWKRLKLERLAESAEQLRNIASKVEL